MPTCHQLHSACAVPRLLHGSHTMSRMHGLAGMLAWIILCRTSGDVHRRPLSGHAVWLAVNLPPRQDHMCYAAYHAAA